MIEAYELEIAVATPSAEQVEYEAIAHLSVDIGPVLPYLNAVLGRAIYIPDEPALSWRHQGRNIGFWPRRIAVDHLDSREQVVEVVEGLVDLVNETWERRAELEPDTTVHQPLQPLELYPLLPGTNCRACGESTCFNFALKLTTGQASLTRCPPLYEPGFEAQRARLEELLATKHPLR